MVFFSLVTHLLWPVAIMTGAPLPAGTSIALHDPHSSQPAIDHMVTQSVAALSRRQFNPAVQGVWVEHLSASHQSRAALSSYHGGTPLPAASLTKLVTSYAALRHWGPHHRFTTRFCVTGSVTEGAVLGDLSILVEGDPLLTEERLATIIRQLKQKGVQSLTGRIVVRGPVMVNFQRNSTKGTEIFAQVVRSLLPGEYTIAATRTAAIRCKDLGAGSRLVGQFTGEPLGTIVRTMNLYSNNAMADQLAQLLDGPAHVEEMVEESLRIPPGQLHLVNGSGLPPRQDSLADNDTSSRNLISPMVACTVATGFHHLAGLEGRGAADYLPIVRVDPGTLSRRSLPPSTVGKTGTLDDVAAFTGIIPLPDSSHLCVSLINVGSSPPVARRWQDALVVSLFKIAVRFLP